MTSLPEVFNVIVRHFVVFENSRGEFAFVMGEGYTITTPHTL